MAWKCCCNQLSSSRPSWRRKSLKISFWRKQSASSSSLSSSSSSNLKLPNVTTMTTKLWPVSRTSRNFSGKINPFISSIRTSFKLWNLAVILNFLVSETYYKSSFSRQRVHSFKNYFSGPISYRVSKETASWPEMSKWSAYASHVKRTRRQRISLKEPAIFNTSWG